MIHQKGLEQDLYRQGLKAHRVGDWVQAEKFYRRALQLQPDRAVLFYDLGVVLAQQSRLEEAAEQYESAIALNPSYSAALENLGCVYLGQGEPGQAIKQFQRAIALDPKQPSLWNNLGQAFYANRYHTFQTAPSIKEKHPQKTQQATIQKAIEAYKQALRLQPDLLITQLNLGVLFQEQEQHEEAITCFQSILEQAPEHIVAHSHCAQGYFRQGNIKAAIYHWQQLATLQSHLLRPYCYQVLRDDQTLNEAPSKDGEEPSNGPKDLLQLARWTCAQFLHCLLQKAPVKESGHWLQQTYTHLGHLLMQEAGGDTQAEYYFRQALCISPKDLALLGDLAHCFTQQRRIDAATMLYCLAQARGGRLSSEDTKDNQCHQPINHSPKLWCYASTVAWVKTTAIAPVQYKSISDSESEPSDVAKPWILNHTLPMADLQQAFHPLQVAENIYRCGAFNPDSSEGEVPQLFTVTIPKGRAWIAPHKNLWKICHSIAVMTPDRTLLSDVSRDYPWRLSDRHYLQQHQHRLLQANISLPPIETFNGNIAILSGLSGHIYYHWMMDVLPRVSILTRAGWIWDEIDGFVVNSVQQPFQQETLAHLGVPNHKILESDRHPHLQADRLIVPSFPGPFALPSPDTIEFLRATFLQEASDQSLSASLDTYPPYLYISRANANYRRVLNEEQVIKALSPLGFVSVTPETLSVTQQAQLFAKAKAIVAPHGAGLTNTVFCAKGTYVVELASPHYVRTYYWVISHRVGLNHYYVRGKGVESSTLRQIMYQNPLTEDIWIPSGTLQSMIMMLKQMI
ncbi:MAG: glycosyltransferase 61 family protein [Cyanobacteria bacterium P01_F01_bin.150]